MTKNTGNFGHVSLTFPVTPKAKQIASKVSLQFKLNAAHTKSNGAVSFNSDIADAYKTILSSYENVFEHKIFQIKIPYKTYSNKILFIKTYVLYMKKHS